MVLEKVKNYFHNVVFRSPGYLLIIVATAVLIVEILIMILFPFFKLRSYVAESVMDAILLTLLLLPILYVFLFRPITEAREALQKERDQLEEMVRERTLEIENREAHYRAVVEGASEGILTLDQNGHIIRINMAIETMFGYKVEEANNLPFSKLITSDRANRLLRPDGSFFPISGLELEAQHKNGITFPILLSISSFKHRDKRYFTAIIQDIRERVMFEKRLARLAYYDALTGLPNRRLFHDRLSQAIERAKRNGKLVGILFLDLDHFKDINDTLGHLLGDQLLQEVSKRLSNLMRKEDTIARMGGDEFISILEGLNDKQDAEKLIQKILDVISVPIKLGLQDIYITGSVGVTFYPIDENDVEKLIMNADMAMYRAKSKGRNTFEIFDPQSFSDAKKKFVLESSFRTAIKTTSLFLEYQPELNLNYQPTVDQCSGEIIGAEALVRWRHPELGIIEPSEFIPLAEEKGFIISLGDWVLRTACEQSVKWRKAGFPPFRIAVNISPLQLKKPDFVDRVTQILEETKMAARYLEMEITESIVLNKNKELMTTLHKLKAIGISLSIDDFGTGQSSLSDLQMLPIDKVKIDESFIRNVTTNENDSAIVVGIIEMAHKIGLKVVAEGVETREQLDYLLAHNCDIMQGYHFSRPVKAEDFETLLVNRIEIIPKRNPRK